MIEGSAPMEANTDTGPCSGEGFQLGSGDTNQSELINTSD